MFTQYQRAFHFTKKLKKHNMYYNPRFVQGFLGSSKLWNDSPLPPLLVTFDVVML